jgi:1-acyl-sn-glycerol-3-phosphate acyltransferase
VKSVLGGLEVSVFYWFLKWVALGPLLKLVYRPQTEGADHVPAVGPAILASKHQSSWETLSFTLLFDDIAIVLKRELLFIPVVGWAMARAGNIAVTRGDGASALRGLVKQAKAGTAR